ncbi:hypothetical protein BB347_11775 [Natronorubrum daqingense]|uniref:Protein-glutamine gamma-glutamyltransferase-like C-terminal domain-containing protein n=1 Tax=Natronorubrum daqingense TaxID=588898 RepID=A0A1P8RFF4_9EURY|nr:hypothetical protein BB347_11775 [Natronorubrum daqingense]
MVTALALCGITALSLAAPTLPTAESVIEDEEIEPPDLDEDEEELLEEHGGDEPPQGESVFPVEWFVVGAALVSLLALARLGIQYPGQTGAIVVGAIAILGVLGGLLWLTAQSGGLESDHIDIPASFPVLVAAVSIVSGLLGAFFLTDRSGDGGDPADPVTSPAESDELPSVDASPTDSRPTLPNTVTASENEIYRAWLSVVDSLEANEGTNTGTDTDTMTPGEIRDAALECGYDPETVDELTRLFEDTRYGARGPTAEREQTARTLARRLSLEGDIEADGEDGSTVDEDSTTQSTSDDTTAVNADE